MEKRFIKLIAGIISFLLCIFALTSLINNLQNIDQDSDGLKDSTEKNFGTNPNHEDTDGDNLNDGRECQYWCDKVKGNTSNSDLEPNGDVDHDGIPNILDYDSDNDGLSDGDEIDAGTDPANPDTDGDGLSDQSEKFMGTNPTNPDSDGDGIPDGQDSSPGYSGGSGDTKFANMNSGGSGHGDFSGGFNPYSQATPSRNGFGGNVTCFAIFDPYLVRMKRYIAYDAIHEDYSAYIYNETLYQIELSTKRNDYVFTGSITLEKLTNEPIPIPSVAANANIISYSFSESYLTASFFKDGADNYYIKSLDYYYPNQVYLTYITSAPASYYKVDIPNNITLNDIPISVKHTPPQSVILKAKLIIDELGLTGETNLKSIVDTLYDYFSSYTEGEIPSNQEEPDIYLAMARAKHGACYIRSFAFFITANSIGLPTRLVTNECHAFVEIYVPNYGWTQIDLGGLGDCKICNPGGYSPFSSGGGTITKSLEPTNTDITKVTPITQKESYFDVEGFVTDKNGTAISGMNVEIFISKIKEENEYKAGLGKTNSDGIFKIRCEVPEDVDVGVNHVIAHALGNKTYDESWSDPTIEIYSNTTLTLDIASSVGLEDNLSIDGKLVDASKKPLSNKIIKIYWDEKYIGQKTTNLEGEFSYIYVPTELGAYYLSAEFEGEAYLNSSRDSKQIFVKDTSTTLTLSISPTTIKRNSKLNLEGKLISKSLGAMSNKTIYIFYNNTNLLIAYTLSTGEFEGIITIPNSSLLGDIVVKAHYPGELTYAEANAKETISVISDTKISLKKSNQEYVEQNRTLLISGLLIDDVDQPVKDVLISLNWTIQNATIKTNQEGEFNFSYDILPTTPLGYITITANFEGDSNYLSSSNTKKVKIVPEGYSEEESKDTHLLITITAIIIICILFFIFLYRKHYTKKKEDKTIKQIAIQTINRLKTEDNDKAVVLDCYKQMCDWLNQKGVKKGSYQTPREFAMAIRDYIKIPPQTLYSLTHIFEEARYSKHDIVNIDKQKAISALNKIVSAEIINIKAHYEEMEKQ